MSTRDGDHGRITKQGASHARWMLVQAAQQVTAIPDRWASSSAVIAKRKNRNVTVATVRKLVTISWRMLSNNEPYRYAQPKLSKPSSAVCASAPERSPLSTPCTSRSSCHRY